MKKLLSKKLAFSIATLSCVLVTSNTFANSNYSGVMRSVPHSALMFEAGGATLTEPHKQKLRNLVKAAELKGQIDQITVAAWSDKSFPATTAMPLADSDRTLAERRLDVIENFLKDEMAISDVDTYNMASESNWLAKTFSSDDAELKSIFGKRGAEVPVTKAEFQIIKNEGGPSEAVVLIEHTMRKTR